MTITYLLLFVLRGKITIYSGFVQIKNRKAQYYILYNLNALVNKDHIFFSLVGISLCIVKF